jgi:DDE_Tnp_1-associated
MPTAGFAYACGMKDKQWGIDGKVIVKVTILPKEGVKLKPKITIADHFAQMSDPRIDRTKRHKLIDILTIAICGVICGADSVVSRVSEAVRSFAQPNSN